MGSARAADSVRCRRRRVMQTQMYRMPRVLRSSLPGLTPQSIHLRKGLLAKKMDARVKPAHDWGESARVSLVGRHEHVCAEWIAVRAADSVGSPPHKGEGSRPSARRE